MSIKKKFYTQYRISFDTTTEKTHVFDMMTGCFEKTFHVYQTLNIQKN